MYIVWAVAKKDSVNCPGGSIEVPTVLVLPDFLTAVANHVVESFLYSL